MSTFRVRLLNSAAVLTLLLGAPSMGLAQSTQIGLVSREQARPVQGTPAPEYGTASQTILDVSITEFRSTDSTSSLSVIDDGTIHYYQNAPAGTVEWWGRVKLPAGSIVDAVDLDACDSTATGSLAFAMARIPVGAAAGGTVVTNVGDTGFAATPGCGLFSISPSAPPLVIDNQNYNYWLYVLWQGDYTSSNKVAGFRLHYHLQVSPAPGTATFSDVPTSYWAFQYVEALAASGITVGCGPGIFCPEDPVTRAQMAVFVAKALGLHWPN